jgi:Ca2+-binding EF-hand superfamily protein
MIRAFAAAGLALLLAPTVGLAQQSTRDHELAAWLQTNTTLERYLEILRNEFRHADADMNGIIDESDADTIRAFAVAQNRTMQVLMVMRYDLDGDGVVTEAEARRYLRYERRLQPQVGGANALPDHGIEAAVRNVMAADADHDGRVTYAELMQSVNSRLQQQQFATRFDLMNAAKRVLKLAPQGKDTVTFADIEPDAEALFRTVDTDKDGKVSADEIRAYRTGPVQPSAILRQEAEKNAAQRKQQRREAAAAARQKIEAARKKEEERHAACALPMPSSSAKVVLFGSYGTDALSTVALGSQDRVTGVGTIDVESGDAPLYVVITSHDSTIWRFQGATGRVERVVITATAVFTENGKPKYAAGVTGVPADRVSFPQLSGCLREFSVAPSSQSAQAAARLKQIVGRYPDVVAARHKVSTFRVPSGNAKSVEARRHQTLIVFGGKNQRKVVGFDSRTGEVETLRANADLEFEFRRFSPGGVISVDAKQVVGNEPAVPYKVLPKEAGLIQLVKSGALTRNGLSEFVINRKIRFPAGLGGAHSVRFLLRRGVPRPDGNPVHSKVISEETGEQLKFDQRH